MLWASEHIRIVNLKPYFKKNSFRGANKHCLEQILSSYLLGFSNAKWEIYDEFQ